MFIAAICIVFLGAVVLGASDLESIPGALIWLGGVIIACSSEIKDAIREYKKF